MDDADFELYGNLKNYENEVYSIPPQEKCSQTQLKGFPIDEAKLSLPYEPNSVLRNKESAKTTNNRGKKYKENAGKKLSLTDQTVTSEPISKRFCSSIGKADVSTSAMLEESIDPPKGKATKGNRRGRRTTNQCKKGGSKSSSNISKANSAAMDNRHNVHATSADVIDLTGCDDGRVVDFISLDSDDETPSEIANQFVENTDGSALDTSFDADNPEVSIKIRWNGNYLIYSLRKYQKFSHIMQKIAESENVPVEDIVFNLDNKFVEAYDTPDSIGYKVYDFIDGRAIKLSAPVLNYQIAVNKKKKAPKCFHLKVQSGQMKQPLVIELKRTDPLKILFIKCAEEMNVKVSQLKLCIDGGPLTMSDTAEDLDLDGGELIEMYIK